MRRSKFTDDQILAVMQELDGGATPRELAERHGVSVPTIYRWRARRSGLEGEGPSRLRRLEEENRRLRMIVAEQALDLEAVKSLLRKKRSRPHGHTLGGDR